MSTAAIHGDFTCANAGSPVPPEFGAGPLEARALGATAPRRRATLQQGRALENVGHAIEYLVDSRLFIMSGLDDRAEHQAVQILMRASRAVFAECAEVVPLRRQLGQWLEKRMPGVHRNA